MSTLCKNILFIVPKNIILLFYHHENLLIVKYKKQYWYLKLSVKYYLLIFKNRVFLKICGYCNIYKIKSYTILINKFIYTILIKPYKKLNIFGVGFKVIKIIGFLIPVLVFKLGFSHSVYIQIKNNISIFCVELSKLFIISNCIDSVLSLIFIIKFLRSVNKYSGKGILFYNEKVKLKAVKST